MMRIFSKMRFGILSAAVLFFCLAAWSIEAAVDPVVVEVHYQNGVKFYNRGLHQKAIQEFEKTLSLDPGHEEARDYLDKVKALAAVQKTVEPQASKDEEITGLYREGRNLYQAHDFEGAIRVFNKILELKPVDDVASFYKERCEIAISRKLAREKKTREKEGSKEKAEKEARISEERRQAREEKIVEKMERQVAKKKTGPPRKTSQRKTREEKREEALARKQEKMREKEAKKMEKIEATREVSEHKELFLNGVEAYGRKQYDAAIADFQELIDAESSGRKVFTNAAQRLMEKAKKRISGEL